MPGENREKEPQKKAEKREAETIEKVTQKLREIGKGRSWGWGRKRVHEEIERKKAVIIKKAI